MFFDRSLSLREHVDHVIIRTGKSLAAMKVMAAAQCEQRLFFSFVPGFGGGCGGICTGNSDS